MNSFTISQDHKTNLQTNQELENTIPDVSIFTNNLHHPMSMGIDFRNKAPQPRIAKKQKVEEKTASRKRIRRVPGRITWKPGQDLCLMILLLQNRDSLLTHGLPRRQFWHQISLQLNNEYQIDRNIRQCRDRFNLLHSKVARSFHNDTEAKNQPEKLLREITACFNVNSEGHIVISNELLSNRDDKLQEMLNRALLKLKDSEFRELSYTEDDSDLLTNSTHKGDGDGDLASEDGNDHQPLRTNLQPMQHNQKSMIQSLFVSAHSLTEEVKALSTDVRNLMSKMTSINKDIQSLSATSKLSTNLISGPTALNHDASTVLSKPLDSLIQFPTQDAKPEPIAHENCIPTNFNYYTHPYTFGIQFLSPDSGDSKVNV